MIKLYHRQKSCTQELNSPLNIEQTQLYDQLTKIQQTIHQKLSQAKKLHRLNYICQHTNTIKHDSINSSQYHNKGPAPTQYETITLSEQCKQYNQEVNYYDLFWKLFLINQNTAWKVNKLYDDVEEMQLKSEQIQELLNDRAQLLRNLQVRGNEKRQRKKPTTGQKLRKSLITNEILQQRDNSSQVLKKQNRVKIEK